MSALRTEICDLLGIRYPIIQTGMGWVATPELVAAVSNTGAIGFLAAATLVPEEVGAEIAKVKALTDQPFGVNFLMDAPGADVIIDAIIQGGVKAAGYNRAPNAERIAKLKDAGVICVPTCGAPKHAIKARSLGADIIIVTDDNPRGEDPAEIRAMVRDGCANAQEIGDRGEAISAAVAEAGAGDIVLIAGKGHEQGQIIGSGANVRVLPFDDVTVARQAAGAKGRT